MKRVIPQNPGSGRSWVCLLSATLALWAASRLAADQVDLQNGDCYFGRVLSLSSDTLTLQSEVLGVLHLPRAKLAAITFGVFAPTNSAGVAGRTRSSLGNRSVPPPPAPQTNANPELVRALRQLPDSTNLVQQVQRQFLTDADPRARDKFKELLGGLMTGRLTVSDIRAEAQSAADQLRSLKRELGDEAGFAVDGYLSILDHFLKEGGPSGGSTTNAPTRTKSPAEAE